MMTTHEAPETITEITDLVGVRPLSDHEFLLFQNLISRETGIYLPISKKALLVRRLGHRLIDLGITSFSAYYRRIEREGDTEERVRMIDCICTNETQFFREPRQFRFLEENVFPDWAEQAAARLRPRRIRAWSVPCSTGEEPFSLAMLLLDRFPPWEGWEVEIVASDLSTRAMDQARRGEFSLDKAKDIPDRFLHRFMMRGIRGQRGRMKVGREIRRAVSFLPVNLVAERLPQMEPFDLIFCRNVLIYFDAQAKLRAARHLVQQLTPGGFLFLGHAESLNGLAEGMRSVMPTIYVHAERALSPRLAELVAGRRSKQPRKGAER